MAHDESDLRERFARLRHETAADAPAFRATLAGARARGVPPPGLRRLRLAVAVAAGLALALLLTRPGRPGGRVAIDPTAVRWRAPTDFLLTLPGNELLRSVPRLGRLTFDGRTL